MPFPVATGGFTVPKLMNTYADFAIGSNAGQGRMESSRRRLTSSAQLKSLVARSRRTHFHGLEPTWRLTRKHQLPNDPGTRSDIVSLSTHYDTLPIGQTSRCRHDGARVAGTSDVGTNICVAWDETSLAFNVWYSSHSPSRRRQAMEPSEE